MRDDIDTLDQIAKGQPSESKQRAALVRVLGSLPEAISTRSPDGLLCRIYVWRSEGVALVSGRGVVPEVYSLHAHAPGAPLGSVYVAARGRHPALTSRPSGAPQRHNPSVKGGRVREDERGQFVEWRPKLPSSGKRPRVRLYGDDPVMVAIDDAQDAINARVARLDRDYGGNARKARRRATLRRPKEPTVKAPPPQPVQGPLYDSQGREYLVEYSVIATKTDGSGPIVASNNPQTMRALTDYPAEFQARILDSAAETAKIDEIANNLQPGRVLARNADPTIGPPVVWLDEQDGRYYVLGGNGRTIALWRAPEAQYRAYSQRGEEMYPALWAAVQAGPGERAIVVREVRQLDGSSLPFADAVGLAAASQASTSAAESPLGEALSLARALGVTDPSSLPTFGWESLLDASNVDRFVQENPAYSRAILDRLDPAQRKRTEADPELSANLYNAVMAAALPDSIRVGGFAGPKEERALMATLPILLTLKTQIRSGSIPPKWDLMRHLDAARAYSRQIRRKSLKQIIGDVERNAAQEAIAGTRTVFDELGPQAVMLAVVLQRAARTRDPAVTIRKYLTPYLEAARRDTGGGAGQGGFSFGAQYQSDPGDEISRIAGFTLPKRYRKTNPSLENQRLRRVLLRKIRAVSSHNGRYPILCGKRALMIDNKEGIGSTPNNANIDYKGFVVFMEPDQFLMLNPYRRLTEEQEAFFADYLDNTTERSGYQLTPGVGAPMLYVTKEGGGFRVNDHEGRGRMQALRTWAARNGCNPLDMLVPVHVVVDGHRARHFDINDLLNARFKADKRAGGYNDSTRAWGVYLDGETLRRGDTGRKTNPSEDAPGAAADLLDVLTVQHFASGSNHPGEIRGFASYGKPVGVAVSVLSKGTSKGRTVKRWRLMCDVKCQDALIEAVKLDRVPVFVDSGAFSEVEFGPRGPVTVAPITEPEWQKRIAVYRSLIERAGDDAALVNVVAPDKIADQEETLRRLRRYAPQMRELVAMGGSLLVPLQKGAIDLPTFHDLAQEALGLEPGTWIPAIPMKKDATTPADLEEYLRARKPWRIHLLGIGPGGQKAGAVAAAVLRGSPGTQVQSDSVLIRAEVGRKGGQRGVAFTDAEGYTFDELTPYQKRTLDQGQYLPGGTPEGRTMRGIGPLPKRLTRAQDLARDEMIDERYSGYDEVRDAEGFQLPDYTDAIMFPSDWLSKSQRERIANELQLPREPLNLHLMFRKDPTEAIQTPYGEDGEILNDDPRYDALIEEAYADFARKLEVSVVKQRAIERVYGQVPGESVQIRRTNPRTRALRYALEQSSYPTERAALQAVAELAGGAPVRLSSRGGLWIAHLYPPDARVVKGTLAHSMAAPDVGVLRAVLVDDLDMSKTGTVTTSPISEV